MSFIFRDFATTVLQSKSSTVKLNIFEVIRTQNVLTQQQCIDEPAFIDGIGKFNRGRISFQGEFRESRPNSVVIPETTDAVRQVMLQDHHVIYWY